MEEIRVSVIIPVYNVEAYLPDCLASVTGQTLREIEILCVDDCSTDRCREILSEAAAGDSRISLFFGDRNRGQGHCRNVGIENARGTYIYLLDSDDMIEPEALASLYRIAEDDRLDAVFFDSSVIYDSPKLKKRYASYPAMRTGEYPEGVVTGGELFTRFIDQQEWTCYIQRQFWRREFLNREGIRFPVRNEHEDEVFAFEGILAAERVRYVRKPWFIRRYRENSVMTKPVMPENFHGYFMCCLYMERFLRERGISSPAADRNLARMYGKMEQDYELLHGKYDLSALFGTEEEKRIFGFFETSRKAWLYYGLLSEKLLERLKGAGRIHIYGAGAIARNVFQALVQEDLVVEDFLVTRSEGNPKALLGRPVLPLSEWCGKNRPEGDLVLIAVTDGYREEIERDLDGAGLAHVYYRDR